MKPVSESIKFAIDTNIVSAFFKGEPDIGARVREAQQVYLPIIVHSTLPSQDRDASVSITAQ
jgi:hypothetical protein